MPPCAAGADMDCLSESFAAFIRRCWWILIGTIAAAAGPSAATSADPTLLERGRYLGEFAAACAECHSPQGVDRRSVPGMALAGGRIIVQRGWRAVAPNITSDVATGIGRWTDAQIAEAVRNARRPDGSLIGPAMPIEQYRGLSDRDVAAIVAWLRSTPPVRHLVNSRSSYPFKLTAWPRIAHVAEPVDTPVARGRYLAGPVAHCIECHSPPLPGEWRDWSQVGAGGVPFEGPWGVVPSSNITRHRIAGIGNWSDERIAVAITAGVAADGRKLIAPMSSRAPMWARLRPGDLRDLIAYLRTLPAQN